MFKRILIATDGSTLARRAEQVAIDLASATGAELVAFCAAPKAARSLLSPAVAAAGMDQAAVDAYWLGFARSIAETVIRKAAKRGVNARAVSVAASGIAEAVVAQARKAHCDLIVMASHGRRGVKRLLLGSETQNVLVQSDLPVLVVR